MGSPPRTSWCAACFLMVPTHASPPAGTALCRAQPTGDPPTWQLALWGRRETLRTAASDGFLVLKAFLSSLPQMGSPQQKPKRLRLVVDVSGSMYRFNGVDGRLERSMEAVCMVMEAFENYEEKFKVTV